MRIPDLDLALYGPILDDLRNRIRAGIMRDRELREELDGLHKRMAEWQRLECLLAELLGKTPREPSAGEPSEKFLAPLSPNVAASHRNVSREILRKTRKPMSVNEIIAMMERIGGIVPNHKLST
jgi:hypothetical protein